MLNFFRRKKYRVKDPAYVQSCCNCGFVFAVWQAGGVLACPRCLNPLDCTDLDPALVLEVEI